MRVLFKYSVFRVGRWPAELRGNQSQACRVEGPQRMIKKTFINFVLVSLPSFFHGPSVSRDQDEKPKMNKQEKHGLSLLTLSAALP